MFPLSALFFFHAWLALCFGAVSTGIVLGKKYPRLSWLAPIGALAAFASICANSDILISYGIMGLAGLASVTLFWLGCWVFLWWVVGMVVEGEKLNPRSPAVLLAATLPSLVMLGAAFRAQSVPYNQPCVTEGISVSLALSVILCLRHFLVII